MTSDGQVVRLVVHEEQTGFELYTRTGMPLFNRRQYLLPDKNLCANEERTAG